MIKGLLMTIMLSIVAASSTAQTNEDFMQLLQVSDDSQKSDYQWVKSYENEYDLVFSKLFLFYKHFISSQDASQCSFSPSCSVYAIQSIKKQGLFWGTINFFDRFSRCNGLSPELYDHEKRSNLLIDPVSDHKFN